MLKGHAERSDPSPLERLFVCLFVCVTGRPCGTRLGPGGPDSSKSSSQAKKPIKHGGYEIRTE